MSTAIANERLRKRFAKWDVNGNGRLERADFEQEAGKIAQAFGRDVNSPEVENLRSAFAGLFDYLVQEAGSGEALTEDQFLSATEKLIFEQGEASFNRALSPLMQGIIGLCDKNADNQINAQEFASWLFALGLDRTQASEMFQQLDKNGNGQLSVDELLGAVRDYHFGRLDLELLG